MPSPLPSVSIAFPSGDMVHADFTVSLAALCHGSGAMDIHILNTKSSIVAIARNNAVAMAQDAKSDYLFFVDSDMVFPATTLLRLLIHQKDVVGATYMKRVSPFSVLGTALNPQPDDLPPGLLEMSRVPTGCLLIKMSVFDRLARPYFHFDVNPENGDIVGEDYLFCDKVKAAGMRIWCDGALSHEIGHIGQTVYRRLPDALGAQSGK